MSQHAAGDTAASIANAPLDVVRLCISFLKLKLRLDRDISTMADRGAILPALSEEIPVPQSIAKTSRGSLYMEFFESLIAEVLHRPEFKESRASGKNNWRSFTSGTKGFTYAVAFP